MWLPTIALFLFGLCTSPVASREITHEDIKDAMLSLVHMMRENTEKLERHEARERILGEQMKKGITNALKKISAVDSLKSHLIKLDERITGIERLFSQRDERERIQMQKTSDALDDMENRLEGWFSDLDNKISETNGRAECATLTKSGTDASDILAKLNDTEALLAGGVARLELGLDAMSIRTKDEAALQADKMATIFAEVRDIGAKIGDLESSVGELKVGAASFEEKSHVRESEIGPAIEEQTRALARVRQILEEATVRIHEVPRISDIQALHNETRESFQEAKHELRNVLTRETDETESKITEAKTEILGGLDALRSNLESSVRHVNHELQELGKGQMVMVSMADHVLDTKKRVEYGVHQILLEVGDLVKAQGMNISNTLNHRFDGISNDIMDNQNGALANLTAKMEQEMNQVWRQINVMYQQMMESAKALDKLHEQNEVYVNGTTTTMGGMKSKVGEITKRMSEVDENLNYLLGRLSLVTQEFNEIKSGLGTALDNIKASFKEVQERANNLSHPGPHPVPRNHSELDAIPSRKPDDKPLPDIVNHIFNPRSN